VPGFDEVVGSVLDIVGAPEPRSARELAHRRFDQIRREHLSGATQAAVGAAKRFIASISDWLPEHAVALDRCHLREIIALHLLADLADGWMCPSGLLAEIIEHEHVSFQTIQARREHAKRLLADAVETHRLAQQLLADSSGSAVTVPRMARRKKSQAEILVTALTR
jgi:hypothetical protein